MSKRQERSVLAFILGDHLEYSATKVFIKALQLLNMDTVSLETSKIRTSALLFEVPRRCRDVLANRQPNLIVVPNMSHRLVPIARRIANRFRIPLWFLPLISQYDTAVFDRKIVNKRSIKALKAFLIDWYGCRVVDRIMFDTEEHLAYFQKQFGKITKASVIPIGVDDEIFGWHPFDDHGKVIKVLFYGGFSPVHGVDVMVRAAALLPKDQFSFTFIGDGPEKSKCEMLATSLQLTNAYFMPNIPYPQLPRVIAAHDVGLGIFGTTQKADRVIPNKVLQTLAVGRPVITRKTNPIERAFKGDNGVLLVEANPSDIADTLQSLKDNRAVIENLGQIGSSYVRKFYGIEAISRYILKLLNEDLGAAG